MCTTTPPHPRGFQDALLSAQLDLGDALSRAIGTGRFNRAAYLRWLAAENALCRVGVTTFERITPLLKDAGPQAWIVAQAAALREVARMAAADVRRTDSIVAAEPVEVDHWRDFLDQHAYQRPYRAIGAIALQAGAAGGAARAAIAALLELPWLPVQASTYLSHRQQRDREDAPGWFGLWQSLPDEGARRDVIEGAMRAADMYRLVCRATLAPATDAPSTPRWRWPCEGSRCKSP